VGNSDPADEPTKNLSGSFAGSLYLTFTKRRPDPSDRRKFAHQMVSTKPVRDSSDEQY
jgi:hypothetical protein